MRSASSATTPTPASSTRRSSSASPRCSDPVAPLVIPWSTGPQSTASQIDETANSIVSKETGTPAGDEGPLSDLFRLALPAGLGEQGPLIKAGLPAVRLSSDGELPLDPAQDTPDGFNTDTFSRFGRASLAMILALDASPAAVEHGPSGYIGLAGNLLPGWTIAMLALALLFPVVLGAGAGTRLLGAQPDRGRSRLPLGRPASRAVPRRTADPARRRAGRAAAQPGLPLRPPRRGTRPRRNDLGGRRAPRPMARSRSSCGRCARRRLRRPGRRRPPRSCWPAWRRSASGRSIRIWPCWWRSACRPGSSPPPARAAGRLSRASSCSVCCLSAPWSPISRAASTPAWASGMTCC